MINGDEGIRTLDLSDANRTLSQLSYAPKAAFSRTPIIIAFSFRFVKRYLHFPAQTAIIASYDERNVGHDEENLATHYYLGLDNGLVPAGHPGVGG